MAELVGLIAGGAGLASLAIQLLESAKKLEQLRAQFRDAPKRLERLANDVRTLSLQLKLISTNFSLADSDELNHSLQLCLQGCRESADDITQATNKLDALLARYKGLGRMAVAFRDTQLKGLCDELEHSKSSLLLSVSIYSELRRQAHAATFEQLLAGVVDTVSQVPRSRRPSLSVATDQRSDNRVIDLDEIPYAVEHTRASQSSQNFKRQPTQKRTFFTITFPTWITSNVWCLALSRAEAGWDVQFRTINYLSRHSTIFQACDEGNLIAVRQMFANGTASIYDTAMLDFGLSRITPLACAAQSGHAELCRFILEQGRRVDQMDVTHLAFGLEIQPDTVTWYNARLKSSEIEDMLFQDLRRDEEYILEGPVDTHRYIILRFLSPPNIRLLKKRADLQLRQRSLSHRVSFASALHKGSMDVTTFLELSEIPPSPDESEITSDMRSRLLFSVLDDTLSDEDTKQPRSGPLAPWLRLAQRWSEGGSELEALRFCFEKTRFRNTPQKVMRDLETWLRVLVNDGKSLEEYALTISKQSSMSKLNYIAKLHGDPDETSWTIDSMLTGPELTDWGISYTHRRQITVWRKEVLPGAWPTHTCLPVHYLLDYNSILLKSGQHAPVRQVEISDRREFRIGTQTEEEPEQLSFTCTGDSLDDASPPFLHRAYRNMRPQSRLRSCSQPPPFRHLGRGWYEDKDWTPRTRFQDECENRYWRLRGKADVFFNLLRSH